jgi:hypothetical protein
MPLKREKVRTTEGLRRKDLGTKRKKAINNEVDDLLIVGVPGFEPYTLTNFNNGPNQSKYQANTTYSQVTV